MEVAESAEARASFSLGSLNDSLYQLAAKSVTIIQPRQIPFPTAGSHDVLDGRPIDIA